MDDVQPPIASAEVLAAIAKSTLFSRALYRVQPATVGLPSMLDQAPEQLGPASEQRLRLIVSSALFSVALDHHAALIFLLQNHMRSSAFSLLRAIFDAVWRGAWGAYVAPAENLKAFMNGRYDPSPEKVIRQLESTHQLPPVLSKIMREGWSTMSDFVHGGALQVQRWVGDGIIEPQHSDAEVMEVLALADRLAFAACVLFTDVANADAEGLGLLAEEFLT